MIRKAYILCLWDWWPGQILRSIHMLHYLCNESSLLVQLKRSVDAFCSAIGVEGTDKLPQWLSLLHHSSNWGYGVSKKKKSFRLSEYSCYVPSASWQQTSCSGPIRFLFHGLWRRKKGDQWKSITCETHLHQETLISHYWGFYRATWNCPRWTECSSERFGIAKKVKQSCWGPDCSNGIFEENVSMFCGW